MAKKKSVQNKIDFDLSQLEADMKKRLDAIPALERYKVLDSVVGAAARPVVSRAKSLTPRGSDADRKKRSKAQKEKANWNIPLHTTISRVIRKYQKRVGVAVIGPKWPDGNKAYLNTSPKGNAGHLWGHAGQTYSRTQNGVTRQYTAAKAQPRAQVSNWIKQAFDETKSAQVAAFVRQLKKKTDEMWLKK